MEVWSGGASLEIRWRGREEAVLSERIEVDCVLRLRGREAAELRVGGEMLVEREGGEGEVLGEVLGVLRRGRGGGGGRGGVHRAVVRGGFLFLLSGENGYVDVEVWISEGEGVNVRKGCPGERQSMVCG